jgi:hypothetical protein
VNIYVCRNILEKLGNELDQSDQQCQFDDLAPTLAIQLDSAGCMHLGACINPQVNMEKLDVGKMGCWKLGSVSWGDGLKNCSNLTNFEPCRKGVSEEHVGRRRLNKNTFDST